MSKFLSTPSARRATKTPKQEKSTKVISIHALREEGDQAPQTRKEQAKYFYPRPPRGGRQQLKDKETSMSKFLSTPSARRATKTPKQEKSTKVISIHALREEGDQAPQTRKEQAKYFYPRPPRGGRRRR